MGFVRKSSTPASAAARRLASEPPVPVRRMKYT